MELTTTYRISSLTLSNASITGTLPAAIGDLYPIRSLTLTGNPGLQGNIPEEISKLEPSLTTLCISNSSYKQRYYFEESIINKCAVCPFTSCGSSSTLQKQQETTLPLTSSSTNL